MRSARLFRPRNVSQYEMAYQAADILKLVDRVSEKYNFELFGA